MPKFVGEPGERPDGDRSDLRAVQRDGRRVDVALGIDPGDAPALIILIEGVLGGRDSKPSG